MKKVIFCQILILVLLSSCVSNGTFPIGNQYGGFVSYGERRHAGLDFSIGIGTPIIAATEGKVSFIYIPCPDEWYCGGIFVVLNHNDQFQTLYGHLQKVYIELGQVLKRGQLIGLSGSSNHYYPHLHFVVCKMKGQCVYSDSYDPDGFWMDGKPQCFDPNKDYTKYQLKELTLPIACGEYAKGLKNETHFLKETPID
jgi:hypothetical protein